MEPEKHISIVQAPVMPRSEYLISGCKEPFGASWGIQNYTVYPVTYQVTCCAIYIIYTSRQRYIQVLVGGEGWFNVDISDPGCN